MLASELEAAQGVKDAVKLEEIHITWQDGLPDDDMEETQIETTRYTAGLTSLESALMRLDGLEGEALQAEIERIRGEQAKTQSPALELPSFNLGVAGEE